MTTMHQAAAEPVVLSLRGLDCDNVYRVAIERAPLIVEPDVWQRVAASREVVERVLRGDRLVYGLNTLLGHMRDEPVLPEVLLQYQVQMVVGHAGGVGVPLADEDVRAIVLARIAGMAAGGSGAHPRAMQTLLEMLNAGVHPIVPEIGSVGASDLMHHAAIAMVAIGYGEARYEGEVLNGSDALARAGIEPYVMQPKDGLALISANGASIGIGALVVRAAEAIATMADVAGALALEVIGGNVSPLNVAAAAAKPFAGQLDAAAHMRMLLHGSYLYDPTMRASVQDPLSFRVIPQVHGALREQIAAARRSVDVELNAMDDNPLVSVEEDRMLSTGNFHPMVLALAFDALRVGLAHVGMLSERRMNKLLAMLFRDPEAFMRMAAEPQRRSSGGLLTYSAAAILAELKHLAAPATLECPPLDLDVEDHATLAPLTVMLTRRALGQLETILAIEALLAVNTLDRLTTVPHLGAGTLGAYEAIRRAVDAASSAASGATIAEAARLALRAWVAGHLAAASTV